jgi:hypothetical protein
VLVAAIGALWAQNPVATQAVMKSAPSGSRQVAFRIAPQTFRDLERRFDTRLATLSPDPNEPTDLLGTTRGIYVDGCGVFFTAEVSLVRTPELSPFLREIPKEVAERVHQRRVERLPRLEAAMDEMLHAMARTFLTVPPDQKLVLAVRLQYGTWESTAGMPAQIMLSGTRAGVLAGEIVREVQ